MTKSLLLVHGAGSGPWIFDGWQESFSAIDVVTVDLQEDLDVGRASMDDYRDQVVAACKKTGKPVGLCGWSMGGLVALMAAETIDCSAVILMEPSPPGEVQGFVPDAPLEEGTFNPEVVYGAFPEGVACRPESSLARGERKRGISVPLLRCPVLVISGDEFREERGTPVAALYGAEHEYFAGLDHWDLVRSAEVQEKIATFLQR
ncbi:MAG TPA: alpha/beta hydrolase [Actinomycetota bacterium]|nr:alpha/beta hydrolase [Actinomycetota bacterium]